MHCRCDRCQKREVTSEFKWIRGGCAGVNQPLWMPLRGQERPSAWRRRNSFNQYGSRRNKSGLIMSYGVDFRSGRNTCHCIGGAGKPSDFMTESSTVKQTRF